MPLTPFHLGPALLLGTVAHRRFDLPALLVGSVVVDVRAALVVFGPLEGPVHGILTTFVGGAAVATLVAVGLLGLPRSLRPILDHMRIAETGTWGAVLAGAIVGVFSHVVLDAMLYGDARPFFPLEWNPLLLDGVRFVPVYAGCVIAGILGLVGVAVRYRGHRAVS